MKLFLSIDEARKILADHLRSKGFQIKDEDVTEKRKTEGQYEDVIEVVTGFEVELPAPDPTGGVCPRCGTRKAVTARGLCRTCSGAGE